MSDLSELLEVLHEPDVPFSSLRACASVEAPRAGARCVRGASKTWEGEDVRVAGTRREASA